MIYGSFFYKRAEVDTYLVAFLFNSYAQIKQSYIGMLDSVFLLNHWEWTSTIFAATHLFGKYADYIIATKEKVHQNR